MLQQSLKTLRALALIIGVFLAFFAFIEILHAYEVLARVHPVLGVAFLLALFCFVGYLFVYSAFVIYSRPRVLASPPDFDAKTASLHQARLYCKYLLSYMNRLSENENLSSEEVQQCNEGQIQLTQVSKASRSGEALIHALEKSEDEVILKVMENLDAKAEREIRNSVRDITLGVTLSPYRAVDLLIVLYKNVTMVIRIVKIYNSRPHLREQILIFRDTMRVVATVNFLNFGEKILETMTTKVPFLGGFVDEMAQGVGAGILTSATGHAALSRCRAYRPWNHYEAVERLHGKIGDFVRDCKGIVWDLLPDVRARITARAPSVEVEQPGFWEKVTGGISSSMDLLAEVGEGFVKVPTRVAAEGVVKGGRRIWARSLQLSKTAGGGVKSTTMVAGRKLNSMIGTKVRSGSIWVAGLIKRRKKAE